MVEPITFILGAGAGAPGEIGTLPRIPSAPPRWLISAFEGAQPAHNGAAWQNWSLGTHDSWSSSTHQTVYMVSYFVLFDTLTCRRRFFNSHLTSHPIEKSREILRRCLHRSMAPRWFIEKSSLLAGYAGKANV